MKTLLFAALLAAPLLAQAGPHYYTTTHLGSFDFISGSDFNATVNHIGPFDFYNGSRCGQPFYGTVTHLGPFDFDSFEDQEDDE